MRDAASQFSNGFHLLSLTKHTFHLLPLDQFGMCVLLSGFLVRVAMDAVARRKRSE